MAKMHWLEKWAVNSWWDKVLHKYFGIGPLLKRIQGEKFDKVLEVGAGSGITTEFIHKKFPQANITATDYDPDQVEEAKERLADTGIAVQQADATQLSFADSSFDACFAILVFHHIDHFPQAIGEILRVLKPGGKFYVLDIQSKFWTLFHLRSFKSLNVTPGLFSREEFKNIVQQSGFRILDNGGKWMFWLIAKK